MMNQNYGFTGRSGRLGHDRSADRGYDRTPYRRSMGRNGMPDRGMYPYGTPSAHPGNGGCGCGMNRGGMNPAPARPIGRGEDHGAPYRQQPGHSIPAMNQNGGCGCGNHNHGGCGQNNGCGTDNGSCKRLMEQIRAVDFALYETVLYLDVYPDSCDALETYHKLKAQSKALHEEYESACGPLTAFGNQSSTSWDWMSKPFPWEYDAN